MENHLETPLTKNKDSNRISANTNTLASTYSDSAGGDLWNGLCSHILSFAIQMVMQSRPILALSACEVATTLCVVPQASLSISFQSLVEKQGLPLSVLGIGH